MAFIDQGEFEAMKTQSGRRAPCCDRHQFRAKMTVRKKERKIMKNGTFATADFCI